MCTKRDKKQNTFKVTDTSDPHKVIVKLKVQTANSDNQTVLLTYIASAIQCVYL